MQEQQCWQAVISRDKNYDGQFVVAVISTGIYCRPSCPSRQPKHENVRFFDTPAEARSAGFRPCKRCLPDQSRLMEQNLEVVEQICTVLSQPNPEIPTLAELGRQFNLSPYHLQRTFKRMVGVTPRQYAAAQRLHRFKNGLKTGQPVTDALYEAGYPSISSVYGENSDQLGMSPGRYQSGGKSMSMIYTVTPCALGWLLVAATEKGICAVRLGDSPGELKTGLLLEFPAARINQDEAEFSQWVSMLVDFLKGDQPNLDLPLDIQATAFQHQVWQALREIPYGSTRSYSEIAASIGRLSAARAVANACADNPAALVIPCHRVVRKDGNLGGYRWGIERKRKLLEQEAKSIKNAPK
jgi:AraC family transcriptional regulator of adaptative response/methylated-DNA-[protein]-cysteine methyltransferase